MGARFVDQRDIGFTAAAELVAEPGGKLESAGAAADDDDAMRVGGVTGCIRRVDLLALHCIGHCSLPPRRARPAKPKRYFVLAKVGWASRR